VGVGLEHHVDEGAGAHAELGVVFHDQVGFVLGKLLLHQKLMAEKAALLARLGRAGDGVAFDVSLSMAGKRLSVQPGLRQAAKFVSTSVLRSSAESRLT
jgi:hypothetical protein